MFHVNEAHNGQGVLTVTDGQMMLHVSLTSKSILKLYPGKAANASTHESDWLQPTLDTVTYEDGYTDTVYGFDIPVPRLEADFDLALIGKKGIWYDHRVSVRDVQPLPLADGIYYYDVTLEGGTGKSTILSPVTVTVADGVQLATLVWSSRNFDYMIVDGSKYLNENNGGNSTFTVPVADLGATLNIIADTVAMSTPHEIEYQLSFSPIK